MRATFSNPAHRPQLRPNAQSKMRPGTRIACLSLRVSLSNSHYGQSPGKTVGFGRILTPPPERRIHPAGRRTALGLPDKSGVPIGMAARLGVGVRMRPLVFEPKL
jgi:hypothetical protein